MLKLICTLFCFFPLFAFAQDTTKPACWKTEINYKTNKVYTSAKTYNLHRAYWSTFNKSMPDPFSLSQAYFTYKAEIKKTEKFSKDKVKHCYIGCRIAAETNIETAEYVAWNKEQDDISDCKLKTHFEIIDYKATVDGAKHPGTSAICEKYCLTHW